MIYFLLSIVLAELVVIVALAARLKAKLESEKQLTTIRRKTNGN